MFRDLWSHAVNGWSALDWEAIQLENEAEMEGWFDPHLDTDRGAAGSSDLVAGLFDDWEPEAEDGGFEL